jgi:hypothetical protein
MVTLWFASFFFGAKNVFNVLLLRLIFGFGFQRMLCRVVFPKSGKFPLTGS